MWTYEDKGTGFVLSQGGGANRRKEGKQEDKPGLEPQSRLGSRL